MFLVCLLSKKGFREPIGNALTCLLKLKVIVKRGTWVWWQVYKNNLVKTSASCIVEGTGQRWSVLCYKWLHMTINFNMFFVLVKYVIVSNSNNTLVITIKNGNRIGWDRITSTLSFPNAGKTCTRQERVRLGYWQIGSVSPSLVMIMLRENKNKCFGAW